MDIETGAPGEEEEGPPLTIPQIDMLRAIAVPFPGDLLPAPTNPKETATTVAPEAATRPEVKRDYANLGREEKLQAILGNLKRHHEQVRSNILAQALSRKEQIDSSACAESWLRNEELQAANGRSRHDAMDLDMNDHGPEQEEATREEEAIVKCLKTVWDPNKPIPHLPGPITATPGSAPLDSSGRHQPQQSERHVELVRDTIDMLDSYNGQAEEGLVYYRRAMERWAEISISTNVGANNNSAGTTPTATSPVTANFLSRSSAFSESARGSAVASPSTRNTAGVSTVDTPRRDSASARAISTVASEYDATRDPRLRR